MSLYGLAMCSHNDPDPWLACHWGITDHPHYHDCRSCKYATVGCEIGSIRLGELELEDQIAETKRICAEIDKFCNTDFEIEDAIHRAHAINNANRYNDF